MNCDALWNCAKMILMTNPMIHLINDMITRPQLYQSLIYKVDKSYIAEKNGAMHLLFRIIFAAEQN